MPNACRAVLLDVRLESAFARRALQGSINVPLYLPIQKWDLPSNIRRAGFAFFGIFGTGEAGGGGSGDVRRRMGV